MGFRTYVIFRFELLPLHGNYLELHVANSYNKISKYTDIQIDLITQSGQCNGAVEGIKTVLPNTSLP